jgi:hypothetical protein
MRVRSWLLGAAGGLLILAAVAHLFGWAQFDGALAAVEADFVAGLHIGWVWGSTAFAAFGLIVVGAAVGWRRHGRDPRPAAAPVAFALVLFGLWALLYRHFNPHFLGFIAMGVLVGAPLVGPIDRR